MPSRKHPLQNLSEGAETSRVYDTVYFSPINAKGTITETLVCLESKA